MDHYNVIKGRRHEIFNTFFGQKLYMRDFAKITERHMRKQWSLTTWTQRRVDVVKNNADTHGKYLYVKNLKQVMNFFILTLRTLHFHVVVGQADTVESFDLANTSKFCRPIIDQCCEFRSVSLLINLPDPD